MKIKLISLIVFMSLCGFVFASENSGLEQGDSGINAVSLPSEVENVIENFLKFYNTQDYEAIYKNMGTSRFQISRGFDEFKKEIASLFDQWGPVRSKQLEYLYSDVYKNPPLNFYRMEYNAVHEKGQSSLRIVLVNDGKSWLIDGFGLATNDAVHFAQGNIFINSNEIQKTDNDLAWSFSKLYNVLKDSNSMSLLNPQKSIMEVGLLTVPEGTKDGPYRKYSSNGLLFAEMTVVNSKPEGEFRRFYLNGDLYEKGSIKNGKLDGKFNVYDPAGNLEEESDYKSSLLVRTKRYDKNGNLISEGKLLKGGLF